MYSAYLKNNGIVNKCINLNIDRVFLKILFFPFIDEELHCVQTNFPKLRSTNISCDNNNPRKNECVILKKKKIIQGTKDHEI